MGRFHQSVMMSFPGRRESKAVLQIIYVTRVLDSSLRGNEEFIEVPHG